MRNQLVTYINLLFAGNPEAEDIKQEILQNTLDRFDDLVAQGRTPEAAYSLAISGIGDISELLQGSRPAPAPVQAQPERMEKENKEKKLLRAVAVGLYIICPAPLFIFQNGAGLGLLLVLVAVATVLIIFAGKDKNSEDGTYTESQMTAQQKLKKSIHSAVSSVGVCAYFIVSFLTGAWHMTWLIFPLIGALNGLITAVMDYKEAQ